MRRVLPGVPWRENRDVWYLIAMANQAESVLFYIPNATLGFHFETELELIQNHLDQGHRVTVYTCSGGLKGSSYFSCLGMGKCYYCVQRRKVGFAALEVKRQDQLKVVEMPSMAAPRREYGLRGLSELKKFSHEGSDVGMATASTLISRFRKPYLDFLKYKKTIHRALDVTVNLVDYFEGVLSKEHFDRIYLFNGRFNIYRPLVRLAQKYKIPFYTHERASSIKKYELFENTTPHDIENSKRAIVKFWKTSEDPAKNQKAQDWYASRRKGSLQSWYSFVEGQRKGDMPAMGANKKVIAIFPSSQDEFEAIQGWENQLFSSQNEGIQNILSHFKDCPESIFIVRVHPNLAGISNQQTKGLSQLREIENCIFIPPEASVDTYALIEIAEKVITFGSTVGVEATYWGTASILAGRSVYEDLDCVYRPSGKKELYDLIGDSELVATEKQRERTMAFGYYFAEFGIPFKHFKAMGLSKGLFRGQLIRPNKLVTYGVGLLWYFYNFSYVLRGEMSFSLLLNKIKGNLKPTDKSTQSGEPSLGTGGKS